MRSTKRLRLMLLVVVASLLLGAALSVAQEGTIVFHSDRSGTWQVYRANADGSNVMQLTDGTVASTRPRVSLDGTMVAYESKLAGPSDIWVMDIDGTNARRVTASGAPHFFVSWSPDGSRLAFETGQQVWVANVDGSALTQITHAGGSNRQASWSPDGQQIVYSSNRDGSYQLYIINIDGTGDRQITNSAGLNRFPAWSPNGEYIVFDSNRDGNYEIYLYTLATGMTKQLTFEPKNDLFPMWSPDGALILFTSVRGANGKESLYSMDLDGANVQPVIYGTSKNEYGSWIN